MKLSNSIYFLLLMLFGTTSGFSQFMDAPEWEISFDKTSAKPGDKVTIHFEAEIPSGWYIYSRL